MVYNRFFNPRLGTIRFLTAWIAVSFIASSCLSTKTARVGIDARTIVIDQDRKTNRVLLLDDVVTYAYFEELILYSLKISLRNNETLSIISFKWNDRSAFFSFLNRLKSALEPIDKGLGVKPISPAKAYYHSPRDNRFYNTSYCIKFRRSADRVGYGY